MFADVWPLSSEHQRKIEANTSRLLKYLDVDQDLVGEIVRAQCLTREILKSFTNTADCMTESENYCM